MDMYLLLLKKLIFYYFFNIVRFLIDQLNDKLYTNDIKNVLTAHGYNIEYITGKWVITNVTMT